MIKRVLRKLERLNADKSKFVAEQAKLQKQIDDIDIEIKNYTTIKKDYERLEMNPLSSTFKKRLGNGS